METNVKLALLAEIEVELSSAELAAIVDIARRAELAGGLVFLMPQGE